MPAFKFRLKTVLQLRERVRDEARTRLAEAFRAEAILEDRRLELQTQLHGASETQQAVSKPGRIDVDSLVHAQRYVAILQSDMMLLTEQIAQLGQEVSRRREALVEADREVRVLEQLQDKQRQRHRTEEGAREAKLFDEMATRTVAAEINAQ